MWSAANAGTGARCSMWWTKHDLEIGHEPDQIHPTRCGVPQTLAPAHGAVWGGRNTIWRSAMNLTRFTRRLEECRKRWHRRTVQYVVEVARIVRAARKAAKDERRWGAWIRNETHMNRTTVYRYLRVAKFLKANVDLNQQLV